VLPPGQAPGQAPGSLDSAWNLCRQIRGGSGPVNEVAIARPCLGDSLELADEATPPVASEIGCRLRRTRRASGACSANCSEGCPKCSSARALDPTAWRARQKPLLLGGRHRLALRRSWISMCWCLLLTEGKDRPACAQGQGRPGLLDVCHGTIEPAPLLPPVSAPNWSNPAGTSLIQRLNNRARLRA